MANCHPLGTEVVVQGFFVEADGDPVTPSAYSLVHRDPSGNTATIAQGSIDDPAVGTLEATVLGDELGVWRYKWLVTIAGVDRVVPGVFCVKANGVD